jgi:hypothetical protein
MPPEARGPVIWLMPAVPDAPTAAGWYKRALGARSCGTSGQLWAWRFEGARGILRVNYLDGLSGRTQLDVLSRWRRCRSRHPQGSSACHRRVRDRVVS